MENARQSLLSTTPIVSRLDHMEFIIKSLERQQNFPRCGATGAFLPLDVAMKEAYFKGSVLERVVALENRLLQLCLELESSSTSSTSTGASGESSSQRPKSDIFSSLPIFNANVPYGALIRQRSSDQGLVPHHGKPQIQENSRAVHESEKEALIQKNKEQTEKSRGTKAGKTRKAKSTNRKRALNRWPHFKFLGC